MTRTPFVLLAALFPGSLAAQATLIVRIAADTTDCTSITLSP